MVYRSFPEWKELKDGVTIRYNFTSWYNGVRADLRRDKVLKRGLKHYLSKSKRTSLRLDFRRRVSDLLNQGIQFCRCIPVALCGMSYSALLFRFVRLGDPGQAIDLLISPFH